MKEKVLIVDDIEINRDMLEEMLRDEYEVVKADGGMSALRILKERYEEFVIVLLDLIMPEVDGFSVLDVMNKKRWIEKTPVIVITGEDSKEAERKSLSLGASDFVRKPFDFYLVKRRVKNIADLFSYRRSLEKKVEQQTETLKKQTETLRKQNALLQHQAEKIRQSNTKVIDVLGTVVEYRNLESGGHIERIKGFTRILAKELQKEYPEYGLTDEKVEQIVSASALHDIGKIMLPDSILLKQAKLTEDEDAYMKSHASRGAEILQEINGVWDGEYGATCYEICRFHHERYDGRGYPDRLQGEQIPISAQLVSIADTYEELVSERIYKDACSPDESFRRIISGECGVFSPKLLECFRNVKKEYEAFALK